MNALSPQTPFRILGSEDDSVAPEDYDVYDATASASRHGRD